MFYGRAWKVTSFGEPEKGLRLQETSWPEPLPGRLLIRVRAAGAGYPDVMMTRGLFPGLTQPPF
jgi:NADPH2:quinone reductase